jgi:hypothetical protein
MKPMPDFVKSIADRYPGIPFTIVCGLIEVESGWDEFAWNPEPRYRYLWNVKTNAPFRPLTTLEIASNIPPNDFPTLKGDRDQEWWGQRASWGLTQVMGAVAREYGFREPYLPKIVVPDVAVDLACRHLARLFQRYYKNYGWPGVLAAYNAGSPQKIGDGSFVNQSYVDKVLLTWGTYSSS